MVHVLVKNSILDIFHVLAVDSAQTVMEKLGFLLYSIDATL